jgi:hypothetical protein
MVSDVDIEVDTVAVRRSRAVAEIGLGVACLVGVFLSEDTLD